MNQFWSEIWHFEATRLLSRGRSSHLLIKWLIICLEQASLSLINDVSKTKGSGRRCTVSSLIKGLHWLGLGFVFRCVVLLDCLFVCESLNDGKKIMLLCGENWKLIICNRLRLILEGIFIHKEQIIQVSEVC